MAESLIIVDAHDGASSVMAAHIARLTGWPIAGGVHERITGAAAWQRLIVVAPTVHGRVASAVRQRVRQAAQSGRARGESLALLTWPPAERVAKAARELAQLVGVHCEPVLVLGPDAFAGRVAEHRIRRWLHPLRDHSSHAHQAEPDTQPMAYEHMLDAQAGPDSPTASGPPRGRGALEPARSARTRPSDAGSMDDAACPAG